MFPGGGTQEELLASDLKFFWERWKFQETSYFQPRFSTGSYDKWRSLSSLFFDFQNN